MRTLILCAAAFALDVVPAEQLVAERRAGHVRDLASCGKKKACIKQRTAFAVSGNRAAATDTGAIAASGRWSEAEYDNLTVWIAAGDSVPHWQPRHRYVARDAFHDWMVAGAPVRFVFVPDSASADVRVVWRDSLPELRAGQVTRFVNNRGWLRAALIELSTRNLSGGAQRAQTMHAVALHEIGHLLGLEHSTDERDIMAAWVTAPRLTAQDRAAVRSLYSVAAE